MTTLHWFRRDLRLQDNPSWDRALATGSTVLPVYIHCPQEDGNWQRGAASNWWLHEALLDLEEQLAKLNCPLILLHLQESTQTTLLQFCKQQRVEQVFWNRCYEPAAVARDTKIKQALTSLGIASSSLNGNLLTDPLKISNKSGKPFQVFTPFWRHCLSLDLPQNNKVVLAESSSFPKPHKRQGASVASLNLLPKIPWYKSLASHWNPTRTGAEILLNYAKEKTSTYPENRDIPSIEGTSKLSTYLHFGQLSPKEVYRSLLESSSDPQDQKITRQGILRQLFWREFSAHLCYHFPYSIDSPLKQSYQSFPWQENQTYLQRWQQGQTGYPIIDAGMRQLWQTGWMHNRVRMIAASFLVKHLLQPWQHGARWFWDTLVDADLANNTMGWQWVAGCGADAAPYFRVFNPILQSKKFDPEGTYIKRWLPELAAIPAPHLHDISKTPQPILSAAGVQLGKTYPHIIITHSKGRQQALNAYAQFQGSLKNTH